MVAHVFGLHGGGRFGALDPLLHGTHGLLVMDLLHGGLAMVLLLVSGGLLGAIAHLHGLHGNLGGLHGRLGRLHGRLGSRHGSQGAGIADGAWIQSFGSCKC